MALRNNDSFNDVMIILSDGAVLANSAIMSSASDYFATMLSNDKFVEAQTKEVSMEEYGTKEAMEQVVNYIYSGDMNLEKIDFETLLEIMHLSKMLLLRTDSLFTSLEAYIIFLLGRIWSPLSILELLRGFMLVERYRLDSLRKHVVNVINAEMQYEEVDCYPRGAFILQQFNVKMIKEILLYKYDPADPTVADLDPAPSTKHRFKFFQLWYSENKDCKAEDKKIILDSFDLDDFTGEELLTVVKESGLFPEKEIDKNCIKKFKKFHKYNLV